jgi:hypothetical protein
VGSNPAAPTKKKPVKLQRAIPRANFDRMEMRILFLPIIFLFGSVAQAQQCVECSSADACIKEYTRATTKIKAEYKKGVADQRKGREQTLREHFSPRATLADESLGQAIGPQIDKLKDCLSKVR